MVGEDIELVVMQMRYWMILVETEVCFDWVSEQVNRRQMAVYE